jgi:hypothetical protein
MNKLMASSSESSDPDTSLKRNADVASFAALLIVMAAVLVVPLLLTNPSIVAAAEGWTRGRYFWHKLICFEGVLFVGWLFGWPIARRMQSGLRMTGGATVIAWAVWNTLIGLLLATILSTALLPDELLGFCIAFAVMLVAVAAVILAGLSRAADLQTSGVTRFPPRTPSPATLAVMLRAAENSLSASDVRAADEIKRVRERISFSLPTTGKIARAASYIELAREVKTLNELVNKPGNAPHVGEACKRVALLLDQLCIDTST